MDEKAQKHQADDAAIQDMLDKASKVKGDSDKQVPIVDEPKAPPKVGEPKTKPLDTSKGDGEN